MDGAGSEGRRDVCAGEEDHLNGVDVREWRIPVVGVLLEEVSLTRDVLDNPEGAGGYAGRLLPHGLQVPGLIELGLVDVGGEDDVVGLPNDFKDGRLGVDQVEDDRQLVRARDVTNGQVVGLPWAAEQSCCVRQADGVE